MALSESRPRQAAWPAGYMLPNVIIAGAQKSGTTSLCWFLEGHPQCAVSEPKEPNYFSRAVNLKSPARYDACFRHVQPDRHKIVADGTTTYMSDPAIPPRIRSVVGADAKIIFTLRAPVTRTYSGYLHMLKRGHERRMPEAVFAGLPDTAEAAAKAEQAAVEEAARNHQLVLWPYRSQYDDVLWNFRYLGNSLYSVQVERYVREFGRDNILVLLMEDMIADPAAAAQQLGRFLDVDPAGFPAAFERGNVTRLPDTETITGLLWEQARRIKRGNFTLVNRAEGRVALKPAPAIKEKLTRILAAETHYWSDYFGRDLRQIGW